MENVTEAFLSALEASSPHTEGLAIDCGANNVKWSNHLIARWKMLRESLMSEEIVAPRLRVQMFEPQKVSFGQQIRFVQKAGARIGVRVDYYPVVAWLHDGNLTFYESYNSETSSVRLSMAARFGYRGQRREVPSIDFAAHILNATTPSPSKALARNNRTPRRLITMLKLDIESSEFTILPTLLARGALCRIDFLLVEWHLNALPPQQRLSGLGLIHAFDDLLRSGCTTMRQSPTVVQHHTMPENNEGVEVPGLKDALRRHAPSNATRGMRAIRWHWDRAHQHEPHWAKELKAAAWSKTEAINPWWQ